MSLKNKTDELRRLIRSFESEAAKFHPVIRDMIKSKQDDQIMFVRFDDADVEGVLSIDGYIDARQHNADVLVGFVLTRLADLGHDHG